MQITLVTIPFPETCPKCGNEAHPTYYDGTEQTEMYKCGSMLYNTGYFKQSSTCREKYSTEKAQDED